MPLELEKLSVGCALRRLSTVLVSFLLLSTAHAAEPDSPGPAEKDRPATIRLKVQLEPLPSMKIGWLGVRIYTLKQDAAPIFGLPHGEMPFTVGVVPDTPAARAGVQLGDIVLSLSGEPMRDAYTLRRQVRRLTGTEVELVLWRVGGGPDGFIACLRNAAEAGNANAAGMMGRLYDAGALLPNDTNEAKRWYRKSVEAGNSEPMVRLARLTKNTVELLPPFLRLAENGDARAMYSLGVIYENGIGVEKDTAQALRWHRRAADKGHGGGMLGVAIAYDSGTDVPQDRREAARWYRNAAAAGERQAMQNLSAMLSSGEGVPQNIPEARRYLAMAADDGSVESMIKLSLLLDGIGPTNDAEKSAYWMFRALEMFDPEAMRFFLSRQDRWSPGFRVAFQRNLAEAGVFKGPIDGNFDQKTLVAVAALREWFPSPSGQPLFPKEQAN